MPLVSRSFWTGTIVTALLRRSGHRACDTVNSRHRRRDRWAAVTALAFTGAWAASVGAGLPAGAAPPPGLGGTAGTISRAAADQVAAVAKLAADRAQAARIAAELQAGGVTLAKLSERADAEGVLSSQVTSQLQATQAASHQAARQLGTARRLLIAEAISAYTGGGTMTSGPVGWTGTRPYLLATYAEAVADAEQSAMAQYQAALHHDQDLASALARRRAQGKAVSRQLQVDRVAAAAQQAALRRALSGAKGAVAVDLVQVQDEQMAEQQAEEKAILASEGQLPAGVTSRPAGTTTTTALHQLTTTTTAVPATVTSAPTSSPPTTTTLPSTTTTATTATTASTATTAPATTTTAAATTTAPATTVTVPTTTSAGAGTAPGATTSAVTAGGAASTTAGGTEAVLAGTTTSTSAGLGSGSLPQWSPGPGLAVPSTTSSSTTPAPVADSSTTVPANSTATSSPGPPGAPTDNVPAPGAQIAVAFAESQMGKPYQWAGAGPGSYDCSGLTMVSWEKAGVSLPHSAQDQYDLTSRVAIAELLPGDLVFFGTPTDVYHVGIYVGNGNMVDAPETGQDVMIQSIYELNLLDGGRVH